MWSVGCVVYELIKCSKENACNEASSIKNRVTFRGGSCYPLSPRESKKHSNVIMKDDQLLVIFKKLGLQTEEDLSFLTNDQMVDYAQKLNLGNE